MLPRKLRSTGPSNPKYRIFRRSLTSVTEHLTCTIPAEPLRRYVPGGYHPIHLGDSLNNARYKVLHKLGWGSHATMWAARDRKLEQIVALKVMVSERSARREVDIMGMLAASACPGPGGEHLLRLHDTFTIDGLSGRHDCLVSKIVGPSISDMVEGTCSNGRLPATMAMSIAKQVLHGLNRLHRHGIAHGEYLVESTSLPSNLSSQQPQIKIIDFGEAYTADRPPTTLRRPLVVRAPEAIFKDKLDHRADLWSMGCLLFELVTSQPPFDSFFLNEARLVRQMLDVTQGDLPRHWQARWQMIQDGSDESEHGQNLEAWLEEVYLDEEKASKDDFGRADLAHIRRLVKAMLRLESGDRLSAEHVLTDL